MPKSHKTVGIKLLIDEATLRAIGHVAAQWAVLEIEFDALLGRLLRHSDAKTIVPKDIPQAFDRRAKLFRECAKLLLHDHPDLQKQIIAIINEATSVRGQRDKVIHGQWHLGRKKGKLGTAVTVINRRPKFKAQLQHMSAAQVEDVAAAISIVTLKLIWRSQMNVG
jgi:hypothetical protein